MVGQTISVGERRTIVAVNLVTATVAAVSATGGLGGGGGGPSPSGGGVGHLIRIRQHARRTKRNLKCPEKSPEMGLVGLVR